MSNTFMIRHLDRIDGDDCSIQETRIWNSLDSKDNMFVINPYICKSRNKLASIIDSLNKNGVEIDHIFCSPFLRCIETAILLTNSSNMIKDKTININFNLSEFLNEDLLFTFPVNLMEIYEHSKQYLEKNFTDIPYILKDLKTDLTMEASESEQAYNERINAEIKLLRNTYEGNILIVTHADAYRQYNEMDKSMKYGEVYKLDISIDKTDTELNEKLPIESDNGGYYKKYLKYKMKYLKLKNNF